MLAALRRVFRGWPESADPHTFTPRPFDHSMSNVLGHVTVVTNRGLHTSSSVNSQQNRLTPDWADTSRANFPGEAFYLYDPDEQEWYSPDLSSPERPRCGS